MVKHWGGTVSAAGMLIVFGALVLFPLYILVKIAVSAPAEVFSTPPPYLIHQPTLEHLRAVLRSGQQFYGPLIMSILTALLAGALSLALCVPAAYAISRFDYRLRYAVLVGIFITRMLPEVSVALPISVSFIRLGLFDTVFGLALAHMVKIVPVCCFILVNVFAAFPPELERQARIDGCTRFGAILRVTLPVCRQGVGVAWLFAVLLSWDEFIYASYLTMANPTMPLKMYYYVVRGDVFSAATYAMIIALPMLALTLLMQRSLRIAYLGGALTR